MSEETTAERISAEFFTVEDALAGIRLDAASPEPRCAHPHLRWIRDGHVSITNGGRAVKVGKSHKLSAGDLVVVDAPRRAIWRTSAPRRWTASASCTWTTISSWWISPPAWRRTPPGWHGPT